VQAFDVTAIHGGGAAILPLDEFFRDIQDQPLAPQHWWLYTFFLAAMGPSIVNLVISGLSVMRGIPQLSAYMRRLIAADGCVSDISRLQIAALLATQVIIGAALGLAAQIALAVVLFRYAMPQMGVEFQLTSLANSLALDMSGLGHERSSRAIPGTFGTKGTAAISSARARSSRNDE
jgi:hypothetical protein